MIRVLGIDPGLSLTGYGVVELATGAIEPTLIDAGVLRLPRSSSLSSRLVQLHHDLREVIEEHRPDRVAVEKVFSHYKHPRTAVLMAHARGVILMTGQLHGLEVIDLPSTEVKKAMTGYGHASKEQIQNAVAAQCGLSEPPSPPDVADAIAIALCDARRFAFDQLSQRPAP